MRMKKYCRLFIEDSIFFFFERRFLCIKFLTILDSLFRLGCPQTHNDTLASAFRVLGLKACGTMPGFGIVL